MNMLCRLWVALIAATVTAAMPIDRADADRLVSVSIVSKTTSMDGPADDRPKRALRDDGVTLYAVVGFEQRGEIRYYSVAKGAVEIAGRRREVLPLDRAPQTSLFWFKVEPAVASMSNTGSGTFRFEPIEYAETGVVSWLDLGSVRADVRPTLTPDRGKGVGTMRYRVVAVSGTRAVASPGAEAVRGRGSGGLDDNVHRVSLRSSDSYLGYLEELYGQPYIWASGGVSDQHHQSERLEGADCADFVIYARRRQGHELAYTWTGDLPKVTRLLGAGTAGEDGIYRTDRGTEVPYSADGDLVLFPRHVGVLAGDHGQKGVLDHQDRIVHAYFDTPKEQALGDTDYAWAKTEVRSWR